MAKRIKLLDRIDNLAEAVHLERDFIKSYVDESLLLAEAIGAADPALHDELTRLAASLLGS